MDCVYSEKEERKRGKILLCWNKSRMKLDKPRYCIATQFFSTGHGVLDSYVDLDEMKTCNFRRTEISEEETAELEKEKRDYKNRMSDFEKKLKETPWTPDDEIRAKYADY